MNNSQLINSTSGEVEYYTPRKIIDRVREFLGGIELDPASSKAANNNVMAIRYFTVEDDAPLKMWNASTLWMNHPFGRAEDPCGEECAKNHVHHPFQLHGNRAWVDKFCKEFAFGNFREGICITYACTSEAWFQPLMAWPQCYLSPRTNYLLPDGTVKKGVTKGSVLTYMGPYWKGFAEAFKDMGAIKI